MDTCVEETFILKVNSLLIIGYYGQSKKPNNKSCLMKTIIHVCQKNHFVFINSLSSSSEVKLYIEKRTHMFTDLFLSLFSYHSHNFMAQYIENIFTIHVSEKLMHYPLKKPIFLGSLAELSYQTWLYAKACYHSFPSNLLFIDSILPAYFCL